VALGGLELGIAAGHIPKPTTRTNRHTGERENFDPNQVFTSPSMRYSYAGHGAYSRTWMCSHPDKPGTQLAVKFAFQCRQRPGSYAIGQQTVAAKCTLDDGFSNDELEWYTKENSAIVIQGLLVNIREVN
jgi:hypothetical protein